MAIEGLPHQGWGGGVSPPASKGRPKRRRRAWRQRRRGRLRPRRGGGHGWGRGEGARRTAGGQARRRVPAAAPACACRGGRVCTRGGRGQQGGHTRRHATATTTTATTARQRARGARGARARAARVCGVWVVGATLLKGPRFQGSRGGRCAGGRGAPAPQGFGRGNDGQQRLFKGAAAGRPLRTMQMGGRARGTLTQAGGAGHGAPERVDGGARARARGARRRAARARGAAGPCRRLGPSHTGSVQ
jgi:hypothetical protein